MTEEEWRGLGVQQSQGWIHYMIHKPGDLKNRFTFFFSGHVLMHCTQAYMYIERAIEECNQSFRLYWL